MGNVRRLLGALAPGLAVVVFAACGGGGGGDGASPGDVRLTDPWAVPSSTPISTDQVFLIRDNGVSAPSGATATAPAGSGTPGAGGGTYTIVSGDTCGSIAAGAGISSAELLAANPSVNEGCTNLQPGQVLAIPGAGGGSGTGGGTSATPTTSSGGQAYTIVSGDTCFDIAAGYGISVDALVAANNIDCDALQPGTVVQIP
jgi:LysM repeat protein